MCIRDRARQTRPTTTSAARRYLRRSTADIVLSSSSKDRRLFCYACRSASVVRGVAHREGSAEGGRARIEGDFPRRAIRTPLRTADAIEAMKPQGVPFGDARMLEICSGVAHADAFHDGARSRVADSRERDDLVEPDPLEAGTEGFARGLARQAPAPETAAQTPPDLDAGRARQHPAGDGEAHEADELARLDELHGPVAPALRFDLRLPEIDAGIAGRLALQRGKELHDARIRVESRERLTIRLAPLPKHEPTRSQLDPVRRGHAAGCCLHR